MDIEDKLVTINSTNSVGVSGTPILDAEIGGGCRVGTSGSFVACNSATHVYANTIGTNPQNPTRPVYDWAAEYAKAAPGPRALLTAPRRN